MRKYGIFGILFLSLCLFGAVHTAYAAEEEESLQITQEELSAMVGISRQTYYAIETRRRQMSWNTYLSLILFFDTNVATHSMLRDINAYPIDLMIKMSGQG